TSTRSCWENPHSFLRRFDWSTNFGIPRSRSSLLMGRTPPIPGVNRSICAPACSTHGAPQSCVHRACTYFWESVPLARSYGISSELQHSVTETASSSREYGPRRIPCLQEHP